METLPFFLDTFIKLTDNIVNLERTRLQNKQQVFKEIVEPLFLELQPIVDNYMIMFRQAKQSVIKSSPENLWDAVQEIRETREAMILARVRVREMAKQIQAAYKDKKITEFAQKIDGFFYRTIFEKQISGKSYAKELVDLCEYVVRRDMDKSELIAFMDVALNSMEISWIAIAQSYASIRIYCLSSPKLLTKQS